MWDKIIINKIWNIGNMTYRFYPTTDSFLHNLYCAFEIFVVIAMEKNFVGQHATHRHIDEVHQPIRVYSLLRLYLLLYSKTILNFLLSVNVTDVKMCNHDISCSTYNCWTLSSIHRSSSWTLDISLLWRNLPRNECQQCILKKDWLTCDIHCKQRIYT